MTEESKADRELFWVLHLSNRKKIIGIYIMDHLIITPAGEFYSRKEQGFM
jgi:hypothetical protein